MFDTFLRDNLMKQGVGFYAEIKTDGSGLDPDLNDVMIWIFFRFLPTILGSLSITFNNYNNK